MVKVIIFDFWGTLAENGVWRPIEQVRRKLGIRLPFSEYVIRLERAMMCQPFKSLEEAFKAVCKEFGVRKKEVIENLIGMWNKSWMLAKPYEETIEVLEDLGKDFKLVLVSNTDGFSVGNVLDKFDLRKYFALVVFSYEVGMLKTDPKFYKLVLEKLKVGKKDCVIVGDSLESDMAGAKKAGIRGILIDRRGKRDFELKIRSLKELRGKL